MHFYDPDKLTKQQRDVVVASEEKCKKHGNEFKPPLLPMDCVIGECCTDKMWCIELELDGVQSRTHQETGEHTNKLTTLQAEGLRHCLAPHLGT